MATITGLTADRMLEIEAASVIDGDVVGGNLILTQHDGTQIDAGSVVGPPGPQGPVGSMLAVLTAKSILDIGLANQILAGRQLGPADFGNIGLSAPLGLWNLSDLTDVSGNGRNLLNKGAVTFALGINGIASSAAQFIASVAQALYIADGGANDPFRIRTGSVGAWFRTAKRGVAQSIISKWGTTTYGWLLRISSGNVVEALISTTGADLPSFQSSFDVCDDRWHFAIFTYDGSLLNLYIDGKQEASGVISGLIFGQAVPLNIGSHAADGSAAAASPFGGRIDEAFVTSDVLTADQIRNLYCAKIPHSLGVLPTRASVNIRRRRRGSALVAADFPTQPLRLHNFSAGSLGDEGSANLPLQSNPGVGSITSVAGADGTPGNAFSFAGTHGGLSSTDAGLPAGLTPRSLIAWFKLVNVPPVYNIMIGYGTGGSGDCKMYVHTNGQLWGISGSDNMPGPFVCDGKWHLAVMTEENAPVDGQKRKLYLDSRLVAVSLVLNAAVLAGANRFRIGCDVDGSSNPFIGQIDFGAVCNYVLTADQIAALYVKGSQALALSPKNAGDHIEAFSATDILARFDALDNVHQVDLGIAS